MVRVSRNNRSWKWENSSSIAAGSPCRVRAIQPRIWVVSPIDMSPSSRSHEDRHDDLRRQRRTDLKMLLPVLQLSGCLVRQRPQSHHSRDYVTDVAWMQGFLTAPVRFAIRPVRLNEFHRCCVEAVALRTDGVRRESGPVPLPHRTLILELPP